MRKWLDDEGNGKLLFIIDHADDVDTMEYRLPPSQNTVEDLRALL